jgi:hypothetical protein
VFSAPFREVNAWSASWASMAMGSNRPKAVIGQRIALAISKAVSSTMSSCYFICNRGATTIEGNMWVGLTSIRK